MHTLHFDLSQKAAKRCLSINSDRNMKGALKGRQSKSVKSGPENPYLDLHTADFLRNSTTEVLNRASVILISLSGFLFD